MNPGTEIKPVGLDRTDPDAELRHAYVQVVDWLRAELAMCKSFGTGQTSHSHLCWMCDEVLKNIRTFHIDKMGRWVGFIQGVMACHHILDVDKERERTRPIFTAAYEAMKLKSAADRAAVVGAMSMREMLNKAGAGLPVVVNGEPYHVLLALNAKGTYGDLLDAAVEQAHYPRNRDWYVQNKFGEEKDLNAPYESHAMGELFVSLRAGTGA